MRIKSIKKIAGFTLIEVLLVLVIISIVIYSFIGYINQRTAQLRIDRTSAQMQQILNAALAYYIANGDWPANLATLQNGTYLPTNAQVPLTNPWGRGYGGIAYGGAPKAFYVYTQIPGTVAGGGSTATANALAIKATLPFGYTSATGGNPPLGPPCGAGTGACFVSAMVNVPGQNLNNATSVNFAGLYHHGACVPVPQCPVDQRTGTPLVAQIMVVPVSVSGVNDPFSVGQTPNVYPINSFTAYAVGNNGTNVPTNTSPPLCSGSDFIWPTNNQNCDSDPIAGNPASAYWRVCLDISTEKGKVSTTNAGQWGSSVTLMAITRCAIPNEPQGSTFSVFSN